ncbi:acyltransferase family protein [Subtercola vilae]|uniref:Acyltransferase n=1 Tax=Subtercola vilae TaxID=2056433 RepID=A0A4T2BZC5_9MICO|nr:acyltransferase [Subtercola vilae]TIH34988.1 acyltransferase [Subtercola vilae]
MTSVDIDVNVRQLSSRQNAFDFLRLLAAVAVVVQHTNAALGTHFAWGLFDLIDGVPMFFIISGMLIYSSAESIHSRTGQFRQFYWNRYLRIAPAIYAFAILTPIILVLFGAVKPSSLVSPQILVWLGSSAALLPNYHPSIWDGIGTGSMNDPLYTIPAEFSFYLIVPILVLVAHRFGFWKMLVPFLAVGVAGSLAYYVTLGHSGVLSTVLDHSFLERGACFAVGIFWAKYWGRIPVKWWLIALALAAYLFLKIFATGSFYAAFKPILLSIPMSYLIVTFGYLAPKFFYRFTKRLGDLSFATYIWQYVVINLVLWFGLKGEWWQTLLVLVITLGVAALSWYFIEKPSQRFKKISLRDRPILRAASYAK